MSSAALKNFVSETKKSILGPLPRILFKLMKYRNLVLRNCIRYLYKKMLLSIKDLSELSTYDPVFIRSDRLGDAIYTMHFFYPLFEKVLKKKTDKIYVICSKYNAEVLEKIPFIDAFKIFTGPPSRLSSMFPSSRDIIVEEIKRFRSTINKCALYDFQSDIPDRILFLSRSISDYISKAVILLRIDLEFPKLSIRNYLLYKIVEHLSGKELLYYPDNLREPIVVSYARLFSIIYGKKIKPIDSVPFDKWFLQEDIDYRDTFGEKYVVINVGGGEDRRLPEKMYVEIIKYILRNYDVNIVLADSPGDPHKHTFEKIVKNSKRVFYFGRHSLEEKFTLSYYSIAYIGPDCGISHLMYQPTNTLIFFTRGNPYRWCPFVSSGYKPLYQEKGYVSEVGRNTEGRIRIRVYKIQPKCRESLCGMCNFMHCRYLSLRLLLKSIDFLIDKSL